MKKELPKSPIECLKQLEYDILVLDLAKGLTEKLETSSDDLFKDRIKTSDDMKMMLDSSLRKHGIYGRWIEEYDEHLLPKIVNLVHCSILECLADMFKNIAPALGSKDALKFIANTIQEALDAN